MKLKEFIDNLNKLVVDRPETLEFDVVSAVDDEGNAYNLIYFTPTIGYYEQEDAMFESGGAMLEDDEYRVPNAVCVN